MRVEAGLILSHATKLRLHPERRQHPLPCRRVSRASSQNLMGAICSVLDKEETPARHEKDPAVGTSAKLQKKMYHHLHSDNMEKAPPPAATLPLTIGEYTTRHGTKLDGLDRDAHLIYDTDERYGSFPNGTSGPDASSSEDAPVFSKAALQALEDIDEITARNCSLAFDHEMRMQATAAERMASARIDIIKQTARRRGPDGKPDMQDATYGHSDQARVFDDCAAIKGREQRHPRFQGDHFLTNANLITHGKGVECQNHLFRIARRMPKAAHLHIHFNSCLLPKVLLGLAEEQDHMFIRTSLPLTGAENLYHCEVQFCILPKHKIPRPGDVYDKRDYDQEDQSGTWTKWMKYNSVPGRSSQWPTAPTFLGKWDDHVCRWAKGVTAQDWLTAKLVFNDDEAHNEHQTQKGSVPLQIAMLILT
jgi:hypothetical protein